MSHNVGGTVSKTDLSAANNSFATASAAFTTAETNYNNAQSAFFSLENNLITADNELFEAQVIFDRVNADPSSTFFTGLLISSNSLLYKLANGCSSIALTATL